MFRTSSLNASERDIDTPILRFPFGRRVVRDEVARRQVRNTNLVSRDALRDEIPSRGQRPAESTRLACIAAETNVLTISAGGSNFVLPSSNDTR